MTLDPSPRFTLLLMTNAIPDRPLKAGELAELAGVSKDTLRFYERRGLLPRPGRTANNYRAYPPEAVTRVLWIRKVLAAGFTVEELARILAERDRGGVPCRTVRDLGAAKLAGLEERIRELEASRDNLREILEDWDRRLDEAGPDRRAGLLDALAGYESGPTEGSPSRKRSDKETSR